MQAIILSVGDEVVSGQIADTNAAWLSQSLLDLGIPVVAHQAVRDVDSEIVDAVQRAASRADLVIVTGGIGPTHDDRTREAVARAAGVAELVVDRDALEHIRGIFAARDIDMPRTNEKQALIPAGADVVRNAHGTAAGFRVHVGRADVFVLPGVPREMKQMFDDGVAPLLPPGDGAITVRMLRCFGLSESVIAQRLGDAMDLGDGPQVAFLASGGVITVKFTARAATREAALAKIEPRLRAAAKQLGDACFGEDDVTLESVVARLLAESGRTIALAESCTGGLVAARLTDVPGISANFVEGCVTYTNEAKTRRLGVPAELFDTVGAVSEEVARAMAEGVRRTSGADLGVGITGIAGPTGGTRDKPVGTVHLAVAVAGSTEHRLLRLRGDRSLVRDRAAKHALDLVRRMLQSRE
jgi:nicotinamide-nucleotide amidase